MSAILNLKYFQKSYWFNFVFFAGVKIMFAKFGNSLALQFFQTSKYSTESNILLADKIKSLCLRDNSFRNGNHYLFEKYVLMLLNISEYTLKATNV